MTTTIDIGVELTAAPDLPITGEYLEYFQSVSDIVGLWTFDRPDLITTVSGKVSALADRLGTGAILGQATAGQRATVVYDAALERNVGRFVRVSGTNYVQTGGGVMDNANPWTLIAVHKPAAYAFSVLGVIGTSSIGTTISGSDPLLTSGTGAASVGDQPQSATGWNRHVGSHPGANSIRQQIADHPIGMATAGASPTGTGLTISNTSSAIAYDGDIDLIMAIKSQDILADPTSDLYLNIKAFLDARGV